MLLFLDLETNGLAKSLYASVEDIDNWPRVVQIAWMIFDQNGKKLKMKSSIISPNDFTISESSVAIHGITLNRAKKEGVPLSKELIEFNNDLKKISTIVAHNADFDMPTLNAEFLRNNIQTDLMQKAKYCTMKSPEIKSFCKIPNPVRSGYKWPALPELHKALFGKSFKNVHNATADVEVCAKCYFELKKRGIII